VASHLRDMNVFYGVEVVVPFLSYVVQILCVVCIKVFLNFGNLDGGSTLLLSVLRQIWHTHVTGTG
jgi:hypothetical protein